MKRLLYFSITSMKEDRKFYSDFNTVFLLCLPCCLLPV